MRTQRAITVVGCHAGGEIGNVVTGGVPAPEGDTVFDQMTALARDGDQLRSLLLHEPRGSVAVHANLIVPSRLPGCAAGFIIMEPTEYPAMSGSNAICTATVLLETGMVEMCEPETVLRLEAPGGVIEARASCEGGRCSSVEITNVASFAHSLDTPIEVGLHDDEPGGAAGQPRGHGRSRVPPRCRGVRAESRLRSSSPSRASAVI